MSNAPAPSVKGRILRPRASRGFTLLELLIVVGIIAFLAVLTLPNIASTLKGFRLTQAGQMVESQLQTARQQALARNREIEMRFYSYASSSGTSFQALQPFVVTSTTSATLTYTPLDKPTYLPTGMIMDAGATLSSLFNPSAGTMQVVPSSALTNPQNLSGVGLSYSCLAFQFKPDGTTTLTPQTSVWFLTVHGLTDGDNLQAPPNDFYAIQIDPYNGHIYDFRR